MHKILSPFLTSFVGIIENCKKLDTPESLIRDSDVKRLVHMSGGSSNYEESSEKRSFISVAIMRPTLDAL